MQVMPALLAVCGLASIAIAQPTPLVITKGQRVALRVPPAAFGGVRGGYPVWEAEASQRDAGVAINGTTDWDALGFAMVTSVRIADLKIDTKKGFLRLKLDRPKGADLNLAIVLADTQHVLSKLLRPASDSEAVHSESLDAIRRRLFGRFDDSVPRQAQFRIVQTAEQLLQWDTVKVVPLQGRPYIEFNAPESDFVYNVNQTSEPERQAGVLNEIAFPIVRLLGASDPPLSSSFGFLIVATIKSKALGEKYSWLNSTSRDKISVYVLGEVASRFAAAEITSQELVDRSVVMFKGNRIKVDLTK